MAASHGGNVIKVVLAGKKAAGKSSLHQNLVDGEKDEETASKEVKVRHISRNGRRICIVDTPGKFDSNSEHLQEFDLLVLCIPVSPGSKFHPDLMQSLHDAYGQEIWKHCIVAFTFSNMAWDYTQQQSHDPVTMYTDYIEKCLGKFQEELSKNLRVKGIKSKTMFTRRAGDHTHAQDILAIPAGSCPQDALLPGVSTHPGEGWVDEIFHEIHRKYDTGEGKVRRQRAGWWAWCTIL